MKFSNQMIVQEPSWTETIKKVNDLPGRGDWIFRALEAPCKDKIPEKNSLIEGVDISILSSFDKAWKSRWPTDSHYYERWKYEAWMLREFKRAAYLYRNTLPAPADHLEWMALARHYEMPSRLVDFTYSFYVASYFASSGKRNKDCGFILAINLKKLKAKTEEKLEEWKFTPEKDDWDFHNPEVFRRFAFKNGEKWVAPVAPSRKNERLLNQQGLFLCPGSIEHSFNENLEATLQDSGDLKLICLHPDSRSDCIRDLRKMNIDMRTLYPDLSGFAQSLRDLVHLDIDTDPRFINELKRSISESPWG